jgi:uncharacterized protein (DUF1778 family)
MPRKLPSEEKRSVSLYIRMTKEQKKAVVRKAKELKKEVTSFCRNLILENI